jgi:TM2 domain-containing membrane protein YozV
MEVQRFEQAILKMAFETDARITTASVAYYLGIPSRKANELLETLLAEGVLELDSDPEGNLFYFVPDHRQLSALPAPKSGPEDDGWDRVATAADIAAGPSPQVLAERFSSTLDEEAPLDPLSPAEHSPVPGTDGASSESEKPASFAPPAPPYQYDWHHPPTAGPPPSRYGSRPRFTSRFDGLPDGSTSRLGRPDARLNRCGPATVVVEPDATCEPKPLANARPTVTTCSEVDTAPFSHPNEYGGFGFTAPSTSTALATTTSSGELALTADGHIEQPEHQPGMALLLSLILCGTGQIYNGEVSKGIIMLILCFLLWFVFLGWVVHIWSIVDAVVVAERINRQSSTTN